MDDADLDVRAVGTAEMQVPCADLPATLDVFLSLGFRIEIIFPADAPTTAVLSGHGLRLRLAPGEGDPGLIRLPCGGHEAGRTLVAPNGTRIALVAADPPLVLPPLEPAFHISRAADAAAEPGRAGMLYRDLIPTRLGGRYIASHIALPEGGPVSDWVHYHRIRFQFLVCIRGWARLVYEDQGPPFLFEAGDCVLQPPLIRHRVLESSAGFEVVEVACPALHETFADHDMTLPNGRLDPDRDFGGQRFLHSRAAEMGWGDFGDSGFRGRPTGLSEATGGLADAWFIEPGITDAARFPANADELLSGFVIRGGCRLQAHGDHALDPSDAFVIPMGDSWGLSAASKDLRLLIIKVPSDGRTAES